eukprot:11139004-Alexandrium_andersonii.AAC.1
MWRKPAMGRELENSRSALSSLAAQSSASACIPTSRRTSFPHGALNKSSLAPARGQPAMREFHIHMRPPHVAGCQRAMGLMEATTFRGSAGVPGGGGTQTQTQDCIATCPGRHPE